VNRAILFLLVGAVLGGGAVWLKTRGAVSPPAAAEAKAPAEEAPAAKVTHDTNGNTVISMTDEMQGNIGLQVTNAAPAQMSPELKSYGRVLDPAPLAALMNELASAQAARAASSNELARLKTLAAQGNASTRILQTAEAAAARDQLAVQSATDRLALSWGKAIAGQEDLPAFIQSLASEQTALVRLDLPPGEPLSAPPLSARLSTLSGQFAEAELLGTAPIVDSQMQGHGFLFLVKSSAPRLTPGAAVVGYLKLPGEPLAGVMIPRDAVVRTEGLGWVYVLDRNGAEAFTRTAVALDHPTEAGWFVTKGVSPGAYVVVSGAQQLLSTESKGQAE
jgi:hypothetical protein